MSALFGAGFQCNRSLRASLIAQEYLDRVEHSGENLAFYLWFQGMSIDLRSNLTQS